MFDVDLHPGKKLRVLQEQMMQMEAQEAESEGHEIRMTQYLVKF